MLLLLLLFAHQLLAYITALFGNFGEFIASVRNLGAITLDDLVACIHNHSRSFRRTAALRRRNESLGFHGHNGGSTTAANAALIYVWLVSTMECN